MKKIIKKMEITSNLLQFYVKRFYFENKKILLAQN